MKSLGACRGDAQPVGDRRTRVIRFDDVTLLSEFWRGRDFGHSRLLLQRFEKCLGVLFRAQLDGNAAGRSDSRSCRWTAGEPNQRLIRGSQHVKLPLDALIEIPVSPHNPGMLLGASKWRNENENAK